MKIFITALTIFASLSTVTAQCLPRPSSYKPKNPSQTSVSSPQATPYQNTGLTRGSTNKCLFGRNYCGWSIRDLHTYEDLKEVYCNSPLCPFEQCGNGNICNPTREDLDQSVYQCDDQIEGGEGTSVFFLGACANSNLICANPEPHCTDPLRVRNVRRGLSGPRG